MKRLASRARRGLSDHVLAASLIASAILVSASIVFAAIPGPTGRIRGCYNVKTGALRVIDPSGKGKIKRCGSGEKAISWNQTGADGLAGLMGPAGPQGVAGANGANGAAGANGANGSDGTDGADGVDGAPGQMGPTGADGVDGEDAPVCGDGQTESPETCDDGDVDNGDGCSSVCRVEPPVCTSGQTQQCKQLGECSGSTAATCKQNGTGFNACQYNDPDVEVNQQGQPVDQESRCDAKDNNCDGTIDESFTLKGSACDGPDTDTCAEGFLICNAQQNGLMCNDNTGPACGS